MDATEEDHLLAAELAARAGLRLLQLLEDDLPPDELRARGDEESNRYLVGSISAMWPRDGQLSVESPDEPVRLQRARVWIVDPLDGTREFGEAGRNDFAVHVALAIDGRPVVGAVALPGRDLLLSTARAATARAANAASTAARDERTALRILVSRTRPPAFASEVARLVGAELVAMGSAGAKAMAVVLGEADAYLHAGGIHEWDTCAPVAVALHHGLHVSHLDGTPPTYNRPDTLQSDLLICRPELAGILLDAVRSTGGGASAVPRAGTTPDVGD
jgi:3'(2'), 5'-bisphosphate nucleotidase